MNGLYTILLLVLSNIFMTLAWYGHLKLQQTGVSSNWPLIGISGGEESSATLHLLFTTLHLRQPPCLFGVG